MADATHYVIRGGIQGRERLRVLGRVLRPTTMALLDRLELRDGMRCADVGCGGGDVTLELARSVGQGGAVTGFDIDETKLEIARAEAAQLDVGNVAFRCADIRDGAEASLYDVVYSRFLLSHLADPAAAVRAFHHSLRPGGRVAVEDIHLSGYLSDPASPALRRCVELYDAIVTQRGGDPDLGPRLPRLLKQAGFTEIGVSVVQPMAMEGEAKLLHPLTMENIAGAVLADGLASQEEIDALVVELYAFAADPDTLSGTPRIVQAWGRRP